MSGCNVLFRHFFLPWYRLPEGVPVPRSTKGDIELYGETVGLSAAAAWHVPDEVHAVAGDQVATMVSAAREDWLTYLRIADPVSLAGIDAFDEHWTRSRVADLIRSSDASDFSNDYLVVCCELGAVLGEVMRQELPSLVWVYGDPYWESRVWCPSTGGVMHPFHWAIKKMSSYGVDDGLRAKVLAGIETIQVEEPRGRPTRR